MRLGRDGQREKDALRTLKTLLSTGFALFPSFVPRELWEFLG